jgi:hypothetical protein
MTLLHSILKSSRVTAALAGTVTVVLGSACACAQVSHVGTDSISVSQPDEALAFGILSAGSPLDSLRPMVKLVAVPGDSTPSDSLPAGTPMKYVRLDEMQRAVDEFNWDREWFRLEYSGKMGWVNEEQLMIFSGLGPESPSNPERCFRRNGAHLVVLYSSRSLASSFSSALALWSKDSLRGRWTLRDLVLDPVACGLYMIPVIDSTSEGETRIHISSIGIDDDDMWGERVTYEIRGTRLIAVRREPVREHRTDD